MMSAIFEDEKYHDDCFGHDIKPSSTEAVQLRVLEWSSDDQHERIDTTTSSAWELLNRDLEVNCELRIVLTQGQPYSRYPDEQRAFQTIFKHYDVPSAFISEHFTSPAYALGKRRGLLDSGVEVAWTRFLCKEVPPCGNNNGAEQPQTFYDNFLWIKCLTFLHTRVRQDGSKTVTLLCFGARPSLVQRFERLLRTDSWIDAVEEPYILFALVYEQLFLSLDQTAWALAGWFRPVERATMDRALREASGGEWRWQTDSSKLHEIAKHGIYLSEAATAAILALDGIIQYVEKLSSGADAESLSKATISELEYRRSAFRSTQLRLSSLDKRIANVISLTFSLVTQRDSRLLMHDSNAMKGIALLTLVFLPMTGIATLFSTPFFDVSNGRLGVATSFWVFWVITLSLTGALVAFWFWWYNNVKRRTASSDDWKTAGSLQR